MVRLVRYRLRGGIGVLGREIGRMDAFLFLNAVEEWMGWRLIGIPAYDNGRGVSMR